MSDYITNDTELSNIAGAIRTKGGTTAALTYPDGFIEAINNISGGGEQPQLYAPTLTITGDTLTITPDPRNGDFVDSWLGYYAVNDSTEFTLFGTLSSAVTSVDLTSLSLPVANYQLKAIASGTNFQNSAGSNIVNYSNIFYDITNNLTHCTSSNSETSVRHGSAYSANITPDTGYTLSGASVSVLMGGVNVTSDVYSDGAINISNVSGQIVINIDAASSAYLQITPHTENIEETKLLVVSPDGLKIAFWHYYKIYVYDISNEPYNLIGSTVCGGEQYDYNPTSLVWIDNNKIIFSGLFAGNYTGGLCTISNNSITKSDIFPTDYSALGMGNVFYKNNTLVWISYNNNKIHIFNTETAPFTHVKEIDINMSGWAIGGIIGGNVCYTTSNNNKIYFTNITTGNIIEKNVGSLTRVCGINDVYFGAQFSDGKCDMYEENGDLFITKPTIISNAKSIKLNTDNVSIIFALNNFGVYKIDGTLIQNETVNYSVKDVALSPVGNKFYVIDTNNTWHIYNIAMLSGE